MAQRKCNRCGEWTDVGKSYIARHDNVCKNVPAPADLARLLVTERTTTVEYFQTVSIGSQSFIDKRFKRGLEELAEVEPQLVEEWREWSKTQRYKDRLHKALAAEQDEQDHSCWRCGMLLADHEQAYHGRCCARCANEIIKETAPYLRTPLPLFIFYRPGHSRIIRDKR